MWLPACSLPLAEPGSVDGVQLGSRHRAAIGITAGSDAVCVVVSEETGIISLASDGKLVRNVSAEQLRDALAGAMGVAQQGLQTVASTKFASPEQAEGVRPDDEDG